MKRPMTLVAGIIATVLDAMYALFTAIAIPVLIAALSELGTEGTSVAIAYVAVVTLISLAFVVVALVLNAIAISGYGCDAQKYRKKRGVIIAAVVFNLLLALLILVGMCMGAAGWLGILLLIGSVAASVLYIVDLCLEKKRVQKTDTTEVEQKAE